MTDETRKTAQDNWFEEFKIAYADYPSQDNEGYVPDRGGFKAGFGAAWRFQESKIAEAVQAEREITSKIVDAVRIHAGCGNIESYSYLSEKIDAIRGQGK